MNSDEFSFAKTWRRLGLTQIWGIPIMIFAIVVVAFSSLAFDAGRLNNYTIMWLPINTLAFLCGFVVVVIFGLVGRARGVFDSPRPLFNLATAAISMGVKNATTLYFCGMFGVADNGSYPIRFLGGAAIGIAILLVYSNIVGARIEQDKIQEELLEKEQYLLGFRENLGEIFKEEEAELRKRTADELIPRLTAIQESIQSSKHPTDIAKAVELLIREEVRPISKSLASEATKLQRQIPLSTVSLSPESKITLSVSSTIRPVASFLVVSASWLSISQMFLRQATGLDIILASLTYLIVLFLIRFSVSRVKQASVNSILLFGWVPGFIASLPGYFLLYQIPHEPEANVLMPTYIIIGSCVTVLFSQALIIERGRAIVEEKLKNVVAQFSRENKKFEQRMWIAKSAWYTLLHGKVQSALTAASMRLAGNTDFSEDSRSAILNDLQRATEALREPKPEQITVEASLEALKLTWDEIANIEFNAEAQVVSRLNGNPDNSFIFNEVIKEAVSNAIKHGGASEVSISLSLDDADNLVLKAENNGSKPSKRRADGIGSKIFEALCLNTSLTWNSSTGKTEFIAVLPIA